MPVEENIALIHRGLDAFSRGDFDGGVADMEPDIEWYVSFRLPDMPLDKPVYHGVDEVRRLWAAFRSGWAKLTVTLEEVVDASEDFVVVRARFVGRGRASGIEVDRTVFYVFEILAGKLKRRRPFDTEEEALEAAGLRVWATSKESVEIVSRTFEAFSGLDPVAGVEAALSTTRPERCFAWKARLSRGSRSAH